MIHPESVEENQLGQIFSNTPWNFLTEGHAAVCNLLRFETMISDSIYRL